MAKTTKQTKQNRQKDKRKCIDTTMWGFFTAFFDNSPGPILASILIPTLAIGFTLALGEYIYYLGMLQEFLIGLILSIEICFLLFSMYFKKKLCMINVFAYKVLAITWGSAFYTAICFAALNYSKWKIILSWIYKAVIEILKAMGIIAIALGLLALYMLLNYLIMKWIDNKN